MPSNLRPARIPPSQHNRPSNWFLNLAAGATISLVLVLVMVVSSVAGAKPPAHADKDIEKCHPKFGCSSADKGEEPAPAPDPEPEPQPDLTTDPEPTPDPVPVSEPTPDPVPEPAPEPDPDPEPSPAPEPTPTASIWSDVAVASGSFDNMVEGRLASDATRTALVYKPRWGREMWVQLVDHAAGTRADVRLPDDGNGSWQALRVTLDGDRLWTLSGIGPVLLREFRIGGTTATPTLTQLATHWHGNSDSRVGDLTSLASGSIVAVWHQQGSSGPNGHGVAVHRDGGSVSVREVSGLGTRASKDVVTQHPADGSIWILSNADASGSIGRIRLVERASGLDVLSVDHGFIGSQHGLYGPDPENPRLAVAADMSSGELVVAYQSRLREFVSVDHIRSQPAVARLAANGAIFFRHLPVWVERISPLGLTVRNGREWLFHRPIRSDGTYDRLDVATFGDGSWSTTTIARLADGRSAAPVDPRRPSIVYPGADGTLHWGSRT